MGTLKPGPNIDECLYYWDLKTPSSMVKEVSRNKAVLHWETNVELTSWAIDRWPLRAKGLIVSVSSNQAFSKDLKTVDIQNLL